MPQRKIAKRKFSESDVSSTENNDHSSDEEYLPQSTGKSSKEGVKKHKQVVVKKAKHILSNASDSDDEPLIKSVQKKSFQNNILPDNEKFMSQMSEKSPKRAMKNINTKKSKEILTDSTSSDDEQLVKIVQKKSTAEKSFLNNILPDNEKFMSQMFEKSPKRAMKNINTKKSKEILTDSTSSDDEQLVKIVQKKSTAEKSFLNKSYVSDEEKPIINFVEPKVEEMSENEHIASTNLEDDKPLTFQSKMDVSNLSMRSNRSSISTDKDNSDKEDANMPEKRCEEDGYRVEKSISLDVESVTSKGRVSSNQKKRKCIQSEESGHGEPLNEQEVHTSEIDETFQSKKNPKDISGKTTRSRRNCGSSEQEVSTPSSDSENELLAIHKEKLFEQSKVTIKNESRQIEHSQIASSSDEDEPLTKITKLNGKSKRVSISSDDSSDEDFTYKNKKKKTPKKLKSGQKALNKSSKPTDSVSSSGESEKVIKKFRMKVSIPSSDSEDEILAIKKEISDKDESRHKEKSQSTSSDEDEPLTKITKLNGKLKRVSVSSDDSSDEDFTFKNNKKKTPKKSQSGQKALDKKSKSTDSSASPNGESKQFSKVGKKLRTEGSTKKVSIPSSDSEDEILAIKKEMSDKDESRQKDKSQGASTNEEPLTKIAKLNGKSNKVSISSDDSSDEDFTYNNDKKKTPKKSQSDQNTLNKNLKPTDISASSDDESEPSSKVAKKLKLKGSTKKVKEFGSSNKRIEHLKKYLRTAGIRIQSYDAFFKDCKSIKSKVEKLLNTLQEKGLKGKPTLQKCKKLKKKIETKREIAELDTANIIKTEGRPKRSGAALTPQNIPRFPAEKKFPQLKYIDSEESN